MMLTMIGAELSFSMGIVGLVLQIVFICFLLSLPGRFREQRELVEQRCQAIEVELAVLQAKQEVLQKRLDELEASDRSR